MNNNGQAYKSPILLVLFLCAFLTLSIPVYAVGSAQKGRPAKTKSASVQRKGASTANSNGQTNQRTQVQLQAGATKQAQANSNGQANQRSLCQNNLRKANRSGC